MRKQPDMSKLEELNAELKKGLAALKKKQRRKSAPVKVRPRQTLEDRVAAIEQAWIRWENLQIHPCPACDYVRCKVPLPDKP